ncbi:MAG: 8-amino-7-oxononanoate synthase [bacterium]|nr:8-amino-7-oxononanoate synthase [bacterium]
MNAEPDTASAPWARALEALERRGRRRRMRIVDLGEDGRWMVDGRPVIHLSSNDYLGLARHPAVLEAAEAALRRWGASASSARLIAGNLEPHREIEEALAAFEGTEAALLYSTGYMANVGVIGAIVGPGDAVYSDELNHASLIDGCRLAGAKLRTYPHADAGALEAMLAEDEEAARFRRRLLVTDGLFSMDGDVAPLAALVDIKERYGCWMLVDEAHATGVLGDGGRGSIEQCGVSGRVEFVVGTLGKSLGSFGAYVAAERDAIDYLVNRSRSFIFTTAPPPPVVAAARAALAVLEAEPERRERLWENIRRMARGLEAIGAETMGSTTQIFPLLVGGDAEAMAFSDALLEAGLFAQGIRPPTVPKGTARLRLTVTASLESGEIDRTLEILKNVGRRQGVIR